MDNSGTVAVVCRLEPLASGAVEETTVRSRKPELDRSGKGFNTTRTSGMAKVLGSQRSAGTDR